VKLDMIGVSANSCKAVCGKKGCVVFYRGDHCIFCQPAKEILYDALKEFGLADTAVYEIDIAEDEKGVQEAGIVGLPTIEICEESFMGLPEDGSLRDALIRALMKDCFCE
jgi:hypothetical protein